MIDSALLAKFKRRAPKIATQSHLDKCMRVFPVEHHEEIAPQVQPLLKPGMTARKVESVPEIKPKDPENPTLHESTVQRLNSQKAIVDGLEARIAADKILLDQLTEERDRLKAKLQDAGMTPRIVVLPQ